MFSRPEAKETESDLLRFQEQFIAGRLNPSATVVRCNTREEPCAHASDKRDLPCRTQVERDVVTLEGRFLSFYELLCNIVNLSLNNAKSIAVCFCHKGLSFSMLNKVSTVFKMSTPACAAHVREPPLQG